MAGLWQQGGGGGGGGRRRRPSNQAFSGIGQIAPPPRRAFLRSPPTHACAALLLLLLLLPAAAAAAGVLRGGRHSLARLLHHLAPSCTPPPHRSCSGHPRPLQPYRSPPREQSSPRWPSWARAVPNSMDAVHLFLLSPYKFVWGFFERNKGNKLPQVKGVPALTLCKKTVVPLLNNNGVKLVLLLSVILLLPRYLLFT